MDFVLARGDFRTISTEPVGERMLPQKSKFAPSHVFGCFHNVLSDGSIVLLQGSQASDARPDLSKGDAPGKVFSK